MENEKFVKFACSSDSLDAKNYAKAPVWPADFLLFGGLNSLSQLHFLWLVVGWTSSSGLIALDILECSAWK